MSQEMCAHCGENQATPGSPYCSSRCRKLAKYLRAKEAGYYTPEARAGRKRIAVLREAAKRLAQQNKTGDFSIISVPGADWTTRHPEVCPMEAMGEWVAEDPREVA